MSDKQIETAFVAVLGLGLTMFYGWALGLIVSAL